MIIVMAVFFMTKGIDNYCQNRLRLQVGHFIFPSSVGAAFGPEREPSEPETGNSGVGNGRTIALKAVLLPRFPLRRKKYMELP